MSRKALVALSIVLGAALVTVAALGSLGASGARGLSYTTFTAAAFTPVEYSDHNKNGNSVCTNFVPHSTGADQFQGGAENQGDLDASHEGSYLENVRLPDGVTVQRLSAFIQDFDDADAYVYLTRKKIAGGLSPRFQGLNIMANVKSDGAVNDTMRKFSDSTVKRGTIDNRNYEYFLELIVCANIEPFAVQIAYK